MAKLIYFGLDDCNRIAVLKCAGYSIVDCESITQLHAALLMLPNADAVAFTEAAGDAPYKVISLIRAVSTVPLILFQSANPHYNESEFDLLVGILAHPADWLEDIASAIAHSSQQSQ